MTGAGTATLAFARESTFKGSLVDTDGDGNPDYFGFGRDPTVSELTIKQALERARQGDSVESVESLEGPLEGGYQVEAIVSSDTFGEIEKTVFNDGPGSGFVSGRANTMRVFAGLDYLDGTVERELVGGIPVDFSISWEEGGYVQFSLTLVYATENRSTSITPSSIVEVTDGTSVAWHDCSLDIDATTQTKLQSFELSIANIARPQRGEDREALDAVMGAIEEDLSVSAIYDDADQIDLAYGGSNQTSVATNLNSVSATIELAVDGTTLSTYNLSGVKPDNYDWADLVAGDTDTTEDVDYQVNGVSVA